MLNENVVNGFNTNLGIVILVSYVLAGVIELRIELNWVFT